MRWFLAILCFPSLAYASDIVRCDPADLTVPNRVTSYDRSVSTETAWFSDPTYIVNPELSSLSGVAIRYWKCSSGKVVEMSASDKVAVDAQAAAALDTALRSGTKSEFDGQNIQALGLRCLAKVLVDELNTIRQRSNDIKNCVANAATLAAAKTCEAGLTDLSNRTLAQAKTAIGSCVDTHAADE